MDLYLLRHGIAEELSDSSSFRDDASRKLTDEGIARTREATAGLVAIGVRPERVYTSPYRRARQTADLFLAALEETVTPLVETEELVPHAPPSAILKTILGDNLTSALCVGHAPHLDTLMSRLLNSSPLHFRLKKCGFAHLKLHPTDLASAELIALVPPKWLRALH